MMSLLLRVRVLAPALAGLLLASCAGIRREPYVVQEPGFLAPVEYAQKASVIAPRIYRDYNPHTFAVVSIDKVYTRTMVRAADELQPEPPPPYPRTMQTIEVAMEQSKIPPGRCLRQCTGPCQCLPPRPRKAITFEFEPSGEFIYTTHVTGPRTTKYRRDEFAWWPSSRRLHGTVHAAKR
ncbi:hypothetical protein [Roseimicrobium sp. ORNL1]|uniref:hypothetical protein n=1 Tax=Roseimicrobium sp. ORNL1 TaxID=2711231 RepID=UPI0013E12833|nr:hypothetical protein [Roseimicrobium sp. ORNL1]QIF01657.1 hypothetical protein G5S37_09025 [Roseimicrobium sp. ORNL1]